ncbi:MAG: tetratricopeptide repeat protein [Chloroflexota bacterium]|nr:tetratricopeptide repeat protein [Chloroflexota bacterium]
MSDPLTSADHVARANDLRDLKRYDLALVEVQQALAFDPDNAEAHVAGTWILKGQERYGAAEAAARAALAADPHLPAAHHALACVLWQCHRLDEAEAAFRLMLACPQDHNEAFYRANYARLLIAWNRVAPGLELADSALACQPNLAYAHEVRGHALTALDRGAAAAVAYRDALRLDPRNFAVLRALGRLELRAGQPSIAVDLLQDALRLQPTDADTHEDLLRALHARQPIYGRLVSWNLRHKRRPSQGARAALLLLVFVLPVVNRLLHSSQPLHLTLGAAWQWAIGLFLVGWGSLLLVFEPLPLLYNLLLWRDPLGPQVLTGEHPEPLADGVLWTVVVSVLTGFGWAFTLGWGTTPGTYLFGLFGVGLMAFFLMPALYRKLPSRLTRLSYTVLCLCCVGAVLSIAANADLWLIADTLFFFLTLSIFVASLRVREEQ